MRGEKATALGKRSRNCYKAWRMLANIEARVEAKAISNIINFLQYRIFESGIAMKNIL